MRAVSYQPSAFSQSYSAPTIGIHPDGFDKRVVSGGGQGRDDCHGCLLSSHPIDATLSGIQFSKRYAHEFLGDLNNNPDISGGLVWLVTSAHSFKVPAIDASLVQF